MKLSAWLYFIPEVRVEWDKSLQAMCSMQMNSLSVV